MRWDRGYRSDDIEDRRGEGGIGGGGIPLGGLVLLGSRFGIKGILIALLIGGLLYGGVCGRSACREAGSPAVTSTRSSTDQDEQSAFVGFLLDDVQGYWRKQLAR